MASETGVNSSLIAAPPGTLRITWMTIDASTAMTSQPMV